MGKYKKYKKKSQTQPQPSTNPFWQNIMKTLNREPLLPTPGEPTIPNSINPSSSETQTHQQEDVEDLVDDNSPNNPIMGIVSGPATILSNVASGVQKPWFTPKQKKNKEGTSGVKKSGDNDNQNMDLKQDTSQSAHNIEDSTPNIQTFTNKTKGTLTIQKGNTGSQNVQETDDNNSGDPESTTITNVNQSTQQTAQTSSRNTSRFRDNEIMIHLKFACPKGIPRSFLIQQQQQQREQYTVAQTVIPPISTRDLPNWMQTQQTNIFPSLEYSNNAPKFSTNVAPSHQSPNMVPNMVVQTDNQILNPPEAYSPSDVYTESSLAGENNEASHEGSESPELCQPGSKRLSAFKRLGPLTQPKKPKLTINLLCNKDQSVREVVDETESNQDKEKYTPVHLRQDILSSTDDTVVKFLPRWPWKKRVPLRRTVTARSLKSVMILEKEQMVEVYEKNVLFIQVSIKGYPSTWKKEDVLDAILCSVKGKQFIPCFIEFTQQECKFLVIRSRSALLFIHKYGFCIREGNVELLISITQTDLTLNHIEFIPRLVLRKRMSLGYEAERKLNLKEFTLKSDISHFIYFPLNRECNQMELIKIEGTVAWELLTDLDLSHNRITCITGFDLQSSTPKLKHLDLSYNYIDKLTILLSCRKLSLRSIVLEGNPLCHDYTDPQHYVKVVKMIFPSVVEIDGIPIQLKGSMPKFVKNYCPEDAKPVVDKFLEVFFPLLGAPLDQRAMIEYVYDQDAMMTVTYMYKLRYTPVYTSFRNLFLRARVLDESDTEFIKGSKAIAKLINKWPDLEHDPLTFTVDVMSHNETTTILRICGIMKLTAETLAENEHLLAFTRTLVLCTEDGTEYKICNEMLYWDLPTDEYANTAFQVTTVNKVKTKKLSLKLESPPDEDLKDKLLEIFMKITDMDRKSSERCLEIKNWNLKSAIEHFTKLLKLEDLESLTK